MVSCPGSLTLTCMITSIVFGSTVVTEIFGYLTCVFANMIAAFKLSQLNKYIKFRDNRGSEGSEGEREEREVRWGYGELER